MMGTEEYGKYVPNNTSPHKLSRDFLLAVINIYLILLVGNICTARIILRIKINRKRANKSKIF